jgi:hypothetical protein
VLSPAEYALFQAMQPSEQLHSLRVLYRLSEMGQRHPNLLAAALLHDVGKSRLPLRIWERALIVLSQACLPQPARSWGQAAAKPAGWRKAWIVAQHHAGWGAEMASHAGSPALTVSLIRRHQDVLVEPSQCEEDHLLALLQAADDES